MVRGNSCKKAQNINKNASFERRLKFIAAFLGLCLSGCAELNSIYRDGSIPADGRGHAITVDAKQRHVFFNPEASPEASQAPSQDGTSSSPTPQRAEVKWRICAEAAPDVFSAYAASGALEGGTNATGGGGKLGLSAAETAATIERTQAINLLRESLYRTCERYLSGAINKTMFIIQAARDQRSMIAFLAIEQLTRTARPPSTIISGPPTSASIKDGEAATKLVETFRSEAEKAKADLADAEAKLAAANKTGKCLESDSPPPAEDEAGTIKAKEDFALCAQAKTAKATSEAKNGQAQERLDKALAIAADVTNSITASTTAGASNSGAGGNQPDSATVSAIAVAVTDITKNAAIDEALMFCIAYLSGGADGPKSTEFEANTTNIVRRCLDMIEARAVQDNQLRAQGVLTTGYQAVSAFDAATPVLKAYLTATDLSAAEKQRRVQLAGKTAQSLGLIASAIDLTNMIYAADPSKALRLLVALRNVETDPAGQAALVER